MIIVAKIILDNISLNYKNIYIYILKYIEIKRNNIWKKDKKLSLRSRKKLGNFWDILML